MRDWSKSADRYAHPVGAIVRLSLPARAGKYRTVDGHGIVDIRIAIGKRFGRTIDDTGFAIAIDASAPVLLPVEACAKLFAPVSLSNVLS